MLTINAESGPLVSHVPFLLDQKGRSAELHLVRSNPILRLLESAKPAVIAVQGPDSYISPDWYGAFDQVPTWNYIAVHLRGSLEQLPQEELRGVLDRISAHFETKLGPKSPWTAAKMTPDVLDRLMRQIVPCKLHIDSVESTWKLNQNKPDDVRLRAADNVETHGIGMECAKLASQMRNPPR